MCFSVLYEVSFVGVVGVALICLDLIWVGVFLVLDHPTRREVG